jgi:hypothetical protein
MGTEGSIILITALGGQSGRVVGRHQTDASQSPYAVVTSVLLLLLRHRFSSFGHIIGHTNYLHMRRLMVAAVGRLQFRPGEETNDLGCV